MSFYRGRTNSPWRVWSQPNLQDVRLPDTRRQVEVEHGPEADAQARVCDIRDMGESRGSGKKTVKGEEG